MKVTLSKYNFNRISKNPNLEAFNMYMLNRFVKDDYGYYTLVNVNNKNLMRFSDSLNKIGFGALSGKVRKGIKAKPSPTNVKKNIITLTAAKKLLRKALALRAARKYTYQWNSVMSEANNIKPKTNFIPRGFIGTVNQKYNRAKLYKQRILEWMYSHPKKYTRPLYRGVYGSEARMYRSSDVVVKNNLTSFSKSFEVAFKYASKETSKENTFRPLILKIKPTGALPSIDYTNKLFTSNFKREQEVLFPPGVFEVIGRPKTSKPFDIILVKFKAL